jgi:arsenate reductase
LRSFSRGATHGLLRVMRNILFLCTGNSARSVLAEAYLNAHGEGRFRAFSAGSHPKASVHPLTLETLRRSGVPAENLRSKSWDEFARPGAPHMDFVITVCDSAAGEACPVWPGHPITSHWSFADPAAFSGSEEERLAFFREIFRQIRNRIDLLRNLPLERLGHLSIQRAVDDIGAAH